MSDCFKGIQKLNDFGSGQFPVWRRLTLAHFAQHAPKTYAVLTASRADVVDFPEDQLLIAGADVLKFLGPALTQLHVRTDSGRAIWDALALEYAEWQCTQAPVLHQRLSSLGPNPGETVSAYCDRAVLLSAAMTDVGRPINDAFLVDSVLQGLARERPAWSPVLLGLRGSMTGTETVINIRGRLAEAEAREGNELAPTIAITLQGGKWCT